MNQHKNNLDRIPRLYQTEHTSLKDKIIHLHFFIGGCDWYIAEASDEILWGFAILNNDYMNAEWGYISLEELKSIKVAGWLEVDLDLYWEPKPASDIEIIRHAHRWIEQGGECYV